MSYVCGLTYLTHDNFLPHQYEGFSVSNDGKNAIVSQAGEPKNSAQNHKKIFLITDKPRSLLNFIMIRNYDYDPDCDVPNRH